MARTIGPLTVDPYLREITLHDERLELTRKEYELLVVLAAEPRRTFTREELYRTVWGCVPLGRSLDTHASRLRHKLRVHGDQFVITVWGVGYRLVDHWTPEAGWAGVLEEAVA